MRFLFLCLLWPAFAHGQPHNVRISDSDNPCEPSIAVNPLNPNELMAGSVLDHVYYSSDGGKTWRSEQLVSSFGVWGDPVLLYDRKGNAYYFHLSNPKNGSWIDRIVCQKYDAKTGKWSDGTYTGLNPPKAQDKHWAACNPLNNAIYLTWTQFDKYGSKDPKDVSVIRGSRSDDGGLTWSTPVIISDKAGDCVDSDNTNEGAVPAYGPDGTLYVAWSAFEKIYFDRSFDGGKTWGADKIIAHQPGGWDYEIPGIFRCNGMPITLCDVSNSKYRGRIYVVWSDQSRGSHDTDVWLIYSDNRGDTWSKPHRVNDDKTERHQFMCWATLDPTNGDLWLVWYDRRNTQGSATEVYMAHSKNGGQNFINFKVSETPFTPNPNTFFGDYTNVTAYGGKAWPIWTRLDDKLSVYTAIVDSEKVNEYVNRVHSYQNTTSQPPNSVGYTIKRKGTYAVGIVDRENRTVEMLLPFEKRKAGRYIIELPSHYSTVKLDGFSLVVYNKKDKRVYIRPLKNHP